MPDIAWHPHPLVICLNAGLLLSLAQLEQHEGKGYGWTGRLRRGSTYWSLGDDAMCCAILVRWRLCG